MARGPTTNGSGSSRRRRANRTRATSSIGEKGLTNVVVRAQLERRRDDLVAAVAGGEDDQQVGELGDPPHQLDAVDLGQHQVEQHQPRPLGPDDSPQVPRRAGDERGVAGLGERLDALHVWLAADRSLRREINHFEVRVAENGDTWIERLRW